MLHKSQFSQAGLYSIRGRCGDRMRHICTSQTHQVEPPDVLERVSDARLDMPTFLDQTA
jgi:hypothetical protein